MIGLSDTIGTVSTDLDGILSAQEKMFEFTVMEFGEMFGDKVSMIKPAGANVF